MTPNPLMEEESHRVYNCDYERLSVTTKCLISESVWNMSSLRYILFKIRSTLYTPACYCGDISKPLNMMRHKTKHDWLLYLSVIWPLGRALAIQSGQGSQTFAISLKVWLHKTIAYKPKSRGPTVVCQEKIVYHEAESCGMMKIAIENSYILSTDFRKRESIEWGLGFVHNLLIRFDRLEVECRGIGFKRTKCLEKSCMCHQREVCHFHPKDPWTVSSKFLSKFFCTLKSKLQPHVVSIPLTHCLRNFPALLQKSDFLRFTHL